jgi:adenylate kinase
LCEKLADLTGFEWIAVGEFAKDNGCIDEYDEEYQCPVLNEDKVHNHVLLMAHGGFINMKIKLGMYHYLIIFLV